MEDKKLVTAGGFSNSMDAHMARLALENEGVEAFVEGDLLPYPGIAGEVNVIQIWVKSDDLQRAKKILDTLPAPALDDEEVELDDSEPFDCEDEEGGGDEGTVNE